MNYGEEKWNRFWEQKRKKKIKEKAKVEDQ